MGLIIPPRFPDWPSRLSAYLLEAEARTFRYGRWDCVLFMAGGIEAMTGADLARGKRGYSGRSGAKKKLVELGVNDWPELLQERACAPSEMSVGDLAVVGGEAAGGICIGTFIKVLTPKSGVGIVPRSDATKGFKI